jgi:predicted porin
MKKSAWRLRLMRAGMAFGLSAALLLGATGASHAQATDAQIRALQDQINQLQKAISALTAAQAQANAEARAAQEKAAQAQSQASQAQTQASQAQATATQASVKAGTQELDQNGHGFLEHKKGSALTFYTPGGEITGYGNLDVSLDDTTKHMGPDPNSFNGGANDTPVGNFGWMPAISTNNSYFGIKGFQNLGDHPFQLVYQLEGGFEISATPGTKISTSNESNTVNGALFSRNSFIGLASPTWGALKIGKTDAPYKNSTAALNPFAGELGDYAVIMGNTGGDNRVEFGTRLDHAIWYESPTFAGGFNFNFLFAPGQNRATDSSDVAAGESDCAGGNTPASGADYPVACNDGSFSNAVSTNISYTNGPLYLTAAGELHQDVNRQSDITAIYGLAASSIPITPPSFANATDAQQFEQDVADEGAAKVAAMYNFSTGTTIGGIVEYMFRDVPQDLEYQNERTRFGTWFVISQKLTDIDSLHFGWAHAFHTPGDPGQHNDGNLTTPDGNGAYASNNNSADMFTIAWKHMLSPSLTWYTDAAATLNGPSAHYDLGAGGRGVTTDCHDANGSSGGLVASPQCWTGQTLVGVSTGLKWTF